MKRILALAVTVVILGAIYWSLDIRAFLQVFRSSDVVWLSVAVALTVPITLTLAWRFRALMPEHNRVTLAESNRLILASSVLNMVLPSKMGDVAKAVFLRNRGAMNGSLALSLVVFERACDVLSLLFWCLLGLVLYNRPEPVFRVVTLAVGGAFLFGIWLLASKSFAARVFSFIRKAAPTKVQSSIESLQVAWETMHGHFWRDRRSLLMISSISVFLWLLHIMQIWTFIFALRAWTPFIPHVALSMLSLLVGLLPITFAGIGTRDAAIIVLYQPYFPTEVGAALGLLCTMRYVIPALVGLPYLERYLAGVKDKSAVIT
jgi:uncharacterized protein (TIRG00374 family)